MNCYTPKKVENVKTMVNNNNGFKREKNGRNKPKSFLVIVPENEKFPGC